MKIDLKLKNKDMSLLILFYLLDFKMTIDFMEVSMRFKKLRAFFSRISFYKVIRRIYEAIAGFILRRMNLNKVGRDGKIPLYKAVFEGDDKRIARLIKNGADINAVDTDGYTLLHTAACIRNREAVALLIKNGADVNAINKSGGTPLHIAVCVENLEIMGLLIKNGADVNATDKSRDGNTSLHILAERTNGTYSKWSYINGAMDLLIKNGADVNKINKYGKTPLHIAAFIYEFESRDKEMTLSVILMLMVIRLLNNKDAAKPYAINRRPVLLILWYFCKAEINTLSNVTFSIKSLGTLSLITVLKEKDENKLALIFQNKEVNKIVETFTLKDKHFRLCKETQDCLLIKQQKGLARQRALDTARKAIFNFNENRQLNEDCWREILKNLPQEDLKNVTKVASLFFKNDLSNDNHNFDAMNTRDGAQMAFNH